MKFRRIKNILTCDWQQSTIAPDLEENKISAVLCISKNKKPPITMGIYTILGIQHYSASIDNLNDNELEIESRRIAKIIHHFVSNKQNILIHNTMEECAVSYAIIYYFIWAHYHNDDGALKPNLKPLEISIASQIIQELKYNNIETDLMQSMTLKLFKMEDKYARKNE
jgi:hypothetical protein